MKNYTNINSYIEIIFIVISLSIQICQQKLVQVAAELPYGLVAGDITGWTVDNGGAANTYINTCYNGDAFGPFGTTEKAHKTYSSLNPHWSIGVSFEYYIAWDWDATESFYFDLDTVRIRDEQYTAVGGQPAYCTGGTGFDGQFYSVGFNITHSSTTALLEFYTNLDQAATDEAFLLNNLVIHIDECHESCLTCDGPADNQCLSCPTNSNFYQTTEYGNQCLCDPGYVATSHTCVNTGCPAGTTQDYVTKTCNQDCPIPNCTTCVNEICTVCSGAYKLLQGKCVETCPFYTTTSGSNCVDSDYDTLALSEYPYILAEEFMEQYFSHSQLLADGWVSNTAETDNTYQYNSIAQRNCNSESLALGFQNKVTGNCDGTDGCYIQKTYTDLPPHFRATIKVQFLAGDTWEGGADDYYEIIVDSYTVDTAFIDNSGSVTNICGNENGDNDQLLDLTPPSFTHYTDTLDITLKYRVNSNSVDEWGGFRELQILLQKCHPNCLTCNNASTCITCIPSRQNAPNCNIVNTQYLDDGTTTGPFPPCENQCNVCTGTAGNCSTCVNTKGSPNACDAYTTCFLYGTIESQGQDDGDSLTVYVNGVNAGYTITDGLAVQVFDYNNQQYSQNNFNTHSSLTESDNFAKFIDSLDLGTYVMVGIRGDGQLNLNPRAYIALQQLGFSDTEKIDYHDGFALIGQKNQDPNPNTATYRIQKRASTYQDAKVTLCMVECNVNCLTCIGGINESDCQSCAGPNFLQLDVDTGLSSCVATCYDNYYPDTGTRSCLNCQAGCKICTGATNCSECEVGYHLHTDNLCYITCPNFFYGNPNTKTCDACDATCETCTGPTQADCTLCLQSPQMFMQSTDNQCYLICPNTQEYGRVSDSTCQPCTQNSADCIQCTDINTCTECQAPSFLLNGYCLTNCPAEQYYEIGPPDNICQPCVANCRTCSAVDPTICLSCYDDRFYRDSLCKVCEDYTGLTTDIDEPIIAYEKCVEKCGDGIVATVGFDGCDDGNNIDGDGCSFDCKVESGYICKGGNAYQRDICFDLNPVRYSIQYSKDLVFEENKKQNAVIQLELVFSKEFILPDNMQLKDVFSLKFASNDKEFKDFYVVIESKDLSQTEFTVNLYLETSLKNRELLMYIDTDDIYDYLGNQIAHSKNTLVIDTYYHYTDQQRKYSTYLQYFLRTYIGLILLYIVPLILVNKFWVMQNILDNCQLIYILGFIKLRQPINGQVFHQEMKAFSDLWLGNPFEYQQYIDNGQQQSENIKSESFMERGYTHNIFNNLGAFMLLLVCFIVIHLILRILFAIVNWLGKETITKNIVQESVIKHPFFHKLRDLLRILVYEFYECRFMHNFWEATYIIFTLFAFLNLRDFKVNVSSITAAVISVVCVLTPIIVLVITLYCKDNPFVLVKDENGREDPLLIKIQDKTFKFRTFWQYLQLNKSKSMIFFQLMLFLKRLFYATVIITLEEYQFLQITLIMTMSFAYLVFISISRPFLRFTDNARVIIIEIIGIVGIGLQYRMLSDNQEDESIRYSLFQDVLICFIICIILNLLSLLYDTWWVFFNICLPNCRRDNKFKVTNLRELREEYLQEGYINSDNKKDVDPEEKLEEKKQRRARPFAIPKKQYDPDLQNLPLQLGNIYEKQEQEQKYNSVFKGPHFLQQNTKKVKSKEAYEDTKNKLHQMYERKHQEQNNLNNHFTYNSEDEL